LIAAWLLALLLALPGAEAAVRKIAVVAGNNEGRVSDMALFFAEDDARKVAGALLELGGYQANDVDLLLGRNKTAMLAAMVQAREAVARAREAGDETLFLFYYSGHADDAGLQLGNSWLTFDELERLVEATGADVRLAFVDACNSGALTREKGGVRAPSFVFDVTERLGAAGTVIITSSSSDEASQESDEIGGSYFTYYLVGGLYGAADRDSDGAVTLAESYDYVYRETVLRTSGTRSGAQHPTFEWDLAGEGDVVLTELAPAGARLDFPASLSGVYAVFDVERRSFVGEVEAGDVDRALAVRPGRYLVQRRYPTHLLVSDLRVREGDRVDVGAVDFVPVEYEDDVAKGEIEHKIKLASRPHTAIRAVFGGAAPSDKAIAEQYFNGVGLAGASVRADWEHRWVGGDLLAGTWSGAIAPSEGQSVAATFTMTTGGLEAGWATRPRALRAGAGLRLAGTYLQRSFDEEQQVPSDQLLTLSPGFTLWAGWWPSNFQLDLNLRVMHIPYDLDGQRGFNMTESIIGMGWRF
jgi:hypothetical protein